jgi:hypothetical protein
MGRRLVWREGEESLISVTPVSQGLFRPLLSFVTVIALVQFGSRHVHVIDTHEWLLFLILGGPCLLVFLTRTWRWRSYKVHVTNERIVAEGGVARHFRSSVELQDVIASHVEQGVTERFMRRGSVLLDTPIGTLDIGRVRHPAALCRLIDLQRSRYRNEPVPLDTVFEYERPDPHDYVLNPPPRYGRHSRD